MSDLAHLPGEDEVIVAIPPRFPNSEEIELLWRIGLFSSEEERALRKLWQVLRGQTDDYLDRVLGMVAAYPALAAALAVIYREHSGESADGSATVRRLFREWLSETCLSPREPSWFKRLYSPDPDLPLERSARPIAAEWPGFRYLIALSFPLVATARSLLVGSGFAPQEIERMQSALLKAILLQVTLLSRLYVKEGFW
jgi:hypothetical protein